MASFLLTLTIEGQVRRYTSATSIQTVGGVDYHPGLAEPSAQVHALGTTALEVDDPATDWPALMLALAMPPLWSATLAYADDAGAIPVQVGIAIVRPLGYPSSLLPLTLDSATVPSARLVPDPSRAAIVAGDWPADDHAAPEYLQDEATIGGHYPRVYGAPGLSAMEADASVGGPTAPGYLVEVGQGAPYLKPSRVVIASPPTDATSVIVYDVSAGIGEDGEWTSATVTPETIEDERGRQVQFIDFEGTVNLSPASGTQYGIGWLTSSPATDRAATFVVADLIAASGRPVDEARMRLGGLLLDVAITEPVDPIAWVLEQLGALPLFVGRSASGFYARIVPVDASTADMSISLGPADSYGDIAPADPMTVPSEITVRYGPIDGEVSREVRLTPTGTEAGATASALCSRAFAEGYRQSVEVALPAVCDPATAARVAGIVAQDQCTPGAAVAITVSDPATIRALLLRGPACRLDIAADETVSAIPLAGYQVTVEAMTVTTTDLTMVCTVRP